MESAAPMGVLRAVRIWFWIRLPISTVFPPPNRSEMKKMPIDGTSVSVTALITVLMAAAVAVLLFFLKDNLKVEYEYTFTNGSLDFAKVFRQAKRKELGSMNVKNVSACGHVAGDSFRRYLAMKDVEKKNWFANRDGNLFYFYYVKESKKHMIIIEPSEEMVEMIRQYLPAGVYQG